MSISREAVLKRQIISVLILYANQLRARTFSFEEWDIRMEWKEQWHWQNQYTLW